MKNNKNFKLLNQTTRLLSDKSLLRKTSAQAVNLTRENLDLIGSAIFLLNKNNNNLTAYTFSSNRAVLKALSIVGIKNISNFSLPIDKKNNLTIQTIISKRPQFSSSLSDFSKDYFPSAAAKMVQKKLKLKKIITYPLLDKSQPFGLIMYGLKEKNPSQNKTSLLETFSKQIALSLSNILAQEKILTKFQAQQNKNEKNLQEKPTIKFTLRLTPSIDQYLDWKAEKNNLSKADYLRKLLKEKIIPNDGDYEEQN